MTIRPLALAWHFEPVGEREPDAEHRDPWLLMEFGG
jgi:hypothetical protein